MRKSPEAHAAFVARRRVEGEAAEPDRKKEGFAPLLTVWSLDRGGMSFVGVKNDRIVRVIDGASPTTPRENADCQASANRKRGGGGAATGGEGSAEDSEGMTKSYVGRSSKKRVSGPSRSQSAREAQKRCPRTPASSGSSSVPAVT